MPENAEETEEAPKSSMLPMIIVGVVALLVGVGGGVGAGMFLLGGGGEEEAAAAAPADGEPSEEAVELENLEGEKILIENPSGDFIYDLERFTVNLRGGGGGRTLRMAVQLHSKQRHQFELQKKHAALRDTVLSLASDYTYGDVEGFDGKQRLKDEIFEGLLQVAEPDQIERVYLTEFQVN